MKNNNKIKYNIADLKIVPIIIQQEYEKETRYNIVLATTDEVIDDAQGYSYKSYDKARKAMWYKFGNGKSNFDNEKSVTLKFLKEHSDVHKYLNDLCEYNFKELAIGETSENDIIGAAEEKYSIKIPKNIFKYL